MLKWVPPQSQATEWLDDAYIEPRLLRRNLRDMARANRWLGAERAVMRQVTSWIGALPNDAAPCVLDVGTGNAHMLRMLQKWSRRTGRKTRLIGCDISMPVLRVARIETEDSPIDLVCCDALRLPFVNNTVDVVTCMQALHHFARDAAERLLRECTRVVRLGVIVSDLRRSYPAYWGARLLAHGPVSSLSRHDGPLSVLRAYTPQEVAALVQQAQLQARIMQRSFWDMQVVLVPHAKSVPARSGAGTGC
jgi:ubiquinone/menaquinone biosynthesis C-methylase UbiE